MSDLPLVYTVLAIVFSLPFLSQFICSFMDLHKLYVYENVSFALKFSNYGFSSVSIEILIL